VIQPFTRNIPLIQNKLNELKAEDVTGQWDQLERILRPLLKEKPVPQIIIASDFANFPDPLKRDLRFKPIAVGSSGENIAITRAALEPIPGNPETQVLFYEIRNFGKEARVVDVDLRLNGEINDAYRTTLNPSQTITRSSEVKIEAPTNVQIELLPRDFLQADNDFTLAARPLKKIEVKVESENPFLVRALNVLPSIQETSTGLIIKELSGGADTNSLSAGLYFLAGPPESPGGKVVQWNETHPVLRFVDAGLWQFSHYSVLPVPPGAQILLETQTGCVAYAQDSSAGKKIVVGFSLEDSNMVLFAGFPVFLQNSIEWLNSDQRPPASVLTGETV
jgi:hypothetical protein